MAIYRLDIIRFGRRHCRQTPHAGPRSGRQSGRKIEDASALKMNPDKRGFFSTRPQMAHQAAIHMAWAEADDFLGAVLFL